MFAYIGDVETGLVTIGNSPQSPLCLVPPSMLCLERFPMTLEWKHENEAETTNKRTQKSQRRVAFGWLSARSGEKTSCPKSFQGSRNQLILRFDAILQHNWPIEQCLLHIRFFFGGKTSPCFDIFIPALADKTNNAHLPTPFFKVIRKSLSMLLP